MIRVTRINGKEFVINTELIKTVEATPDTVIRLVSEDKYVVVESVEEVIRRVIDYRRSCYLTVAQEIFAGQGRLGEGVSQ